MSSYTRPRNSEEQRVVITGIGILSPLGITTKETWNNLIEGVSGIGKIQAFDTTNYDCQIAGEVKPFETDPFIPKKDLKKMDRFIQMSIVASHEALKDSGFEITDMNSSRVGCLVGAGMGGLPFIEKQHSILMERGPSRVSPFFIPMVIANMAAGQISIQMKAKGPNYCITSACASGAHAIGEATRYIRDGLCDMMIAGGAESVVSPMAIAGFSNMKALSTRNNQPTMASRPFDKDRDGFVLSEGAAILILERYEIAKNRGAKIYAEISGYGASSDAYHMTSPSSEGDGAQRAMQLALKDARLNPTDIQYINAHGTSTPAGDELEALAIKRTFHDHAKKLMVSSTKSMTGHLLGAAGALESAFCALTLSEGIIPPTINLENPSDGCDLDLVPLSARKAPSQHVMNNSFGFGGTNSTLVFSKI